MKVMWDGFEIFIYVSSIQPLSGRSSQAQSGASGTNLLVCRYMCWTMTDNGRRRCDRMKTFKSCLSMCTTKSPLLPTLYVTVDDTSRCVMDVFVWMLLDTQVLQLLVVTFDCCHNDWMRLAHGRIRYFVIFNKQHAISGKECWNYEN